MKKSKNSEPDAAAKKSGAMCQKDGCRATAYPAGFCLSHLTHSEPVKKSLAPELPTVDACCSKKGCKSPARFDGKCLLHAAVAQGDHVRKAGRCRRQPGHTGPCNGFDCGMRADQVELRCDGCGSTCFTDDQRCEVCGSRLRSFAPKVVRRPFDARQFLLERKERAAAWKARRDNEAAASAVIMGQPISSIKWGSHGGKPRYPLLQKFNQRRAASGHNNCACGCGATILDAALLSDADKAAEWAKETFEDMDGICWQRHASLRSVFGNAIPPHLQTWAMKELKRTLARRAKDSGMPNKINTMDVCLLIERLIEKQTASASAGIRAARQGACEKCGNWTWWTVVASWGRSGAYWCGCD